SASSSTTLTASSRPRSPIRPIQPPRPNPSAPAGSSTTPSSVTFSLITIFPISVRSYAAGAWRSRVACASVPEDTLTVCAQRLCGSRAEAGLAPHVHAVADPGHARARVRDAVDDDEAVEADADPAEDAAGLALHRRSRRDLALREQHGRDGLAL